MAAEYDPFPLFLPKLKPDSTIRTGVTAGEWLVHPAKAFQEVAESLDYSAPDEVKSISSMPTMWARPLTVEMALHSRNHPIRRQMIEQWQGMLAAIALSELRGFPLKAELLELETVKNTNRFGRSLYELLPDPTRALYRENGKHPWEDLYIFLWDKNPVGMTSPSTLVVPSEGGDWTALPWWRNGRLQSPVGGFQGAINNLEKELLWGWLRHLCIGLYQYSGELNTYSHPATNTLVELIGQFQASLLEAPPSNHDPSLSENQRYFGVTINRGVLRGLNQPVKPAAQPSSVKVIASPAKTPAKPLILIDNKIAKEWNEPSHNIWIHQGITLASLKLEDLRKGQIQWDDVRWIEPEQLFLPKLTFVDHRDDALPGSFKPKMDKPITLSGERVTPLLPLNSLLLDYFTPEDLCERLKIEPINEGGENQVAVTFNLPLTGYSRPYSITKTYTLSKDNAIEGLPVLEVWPNFRSATWKEYFGFYYDAELENTFQVRFPQNKEEHEFADVRGGVHQIIRLEQFPEVIECLNRRREPLGLILPKPQQEVTLLTGSWKVGVDFGTSFTNLYVNRKSGAERLNLESLHLKITESQRVTRFLELFEYFIPEEFLPPEEPLPLSTVLTERGSRDTNKRNNDPSPIFDGRIYVPTTQFEPNADWMDTNLKWTNRRGNRLFRKHLGLHVSALAHKNGIEQINWSFSYPSAFSRNERAEYAITWSQIISALQDRTGVVQSCTTGWDSGSFKTESLSVAQYFADKEEHDLIYTTCIDMGAGTSDISIWDSNRLLHQCSVQLAGQDLFSQFMEMKPQFLEKRFNVNLKDWQGLRGGVFSVKLDMLLRWESQDWLKLKRALLTNDSEFQGLVQIMAIGIGGLYYYVGMLLRALSLEGKYSRQLITPVYLGGNGSRFLNWLAHTGSFNADSVINDLLSRMLSKGTTMIDETGSEIVFPDSQVKTVLSQMPKDEVACGLVLDDTRLEGLVNQYDPLIAGEGYELNGKIYAWYDRLHVEEDVESFSLTSLERLSKFLYDFHEAQTSLKIEDIKPLKRYNRSLLKTDNSALWEGTGRVLEVLLHGDTFKGDPTMIRFEPPFILGLKALLIYLGKEWARQ